MVKNPPSKAREAIHTVSIPGSGRSLRGGHGNHSCVLARRIPWSEEPGGLQSVGLQRVRYDWTHTARKRTGTTFFPS